MIRKRFREAVVTPIKAMRLRYLPLLMIYFAYGASGFSAIAQDFWVKEHLGLSTEALMMIAVWISLPWTIKMVFGQFADSIPVLGSVRRSYIFIAAGLMVIGSLLMAGMAGEWEMVVSLGSKGAVFLLAQLLLMIGFVLQDVVADAMSVEVVEREGRTEEEIGTDLGNVQLLGRLALAIAMFIVAGLGGWLANIFSYEMIFLMTFAIPVISIIGSLFVKLERTNLKPINWHVLGGGLAYAVFVVCMGLFSVPYNQEIIFGVSMIVVVYLLHSVTRELPRKTLWAIVCVAIVIFVYRAMPSIGPGATWWQIDVLGFDKPFFGTLAQIGAGISILTMWLFAKSLTRPNLIRRVFFWLTILGFLLSLPLIGMYYGLHEWTQVHLGFGARTIALVDTAAASPLVQISMVPMLTLVAMYAPKGNAATWFALMASLMNLALTAGNLMSKYINSIWIVTREVQDNAGNIITHADYSQLGMIFILTTAMGFVLPLLAILIFMGENTMTIESKK